MRFHTMEYTLANLREVVKRDEAFLDEKKLAWSKSINYSVPHLTSKTKIDFTCNCGESHTKLLMSIFNGGAKCSTCTRAAADIKNKAAHIKISKDLGYFMYDKANLLQLVDTAGATLVTKIEDTPKLKQSDYIKYVCQCGEECEWYYSTIRDRGGAYCQSCVKLGFGNRKERQAKIKLQESVSYPNKTRCRSCRQLKPKRDFVSNGTTCTICREKSTKFNDDMDDYTLLVKKKKGPCVDCGETNVNVLQFDHIDRGNKLRGVTKCRSIKTIDEEAAKCEMRCCICHIRKTREELSWKIQPTPAQKYVDEIKRKIGGCSLCGWYDKTLLEALHFDHLDRDTKSASISAFAIKNCQEQVDTEIEKCRLICANCHRLHTIKQLGFLDNEFMPKSEARQLRKELTMLAEDFVEYSSSEDSYTD